jgi:hypothetical protein
MLCGIYANNITIRGVNGRPKIEHDAHVGRNLKSRAQIAAK